MTRANTEAAITAAMIKTVYGAEMERTAGYRERDILRHVNRITTETDRGALVINLYTVPDETGHRDGAQYHTGRHTWTG